MQISNSYSQPASMVSAFLLQNMPRIQAEPERIVTLRSEVVKQGTPSDQPIYEMFSLGEAGDKKSIVSHFTGIKDQIYPIMRHIYYEGLAKNVFEKSITLQAAQEAKTFFPAQAHHKQAMPLFVTTDEIFAPVFGGGLNDYEVDSGPIFAHYRQDWHQGLRHARETATEEEASHPYYQKLLDYFREGENDIIYPSFFFAEYRHAQIKTNVGPRSINAWEIIAAEPHRLRSIALAYTQEAAAIGLSILDKGFIKPVIDADPELKRLREFNLLNYKGVWQKETSSFPGITRSHLMDAIMIDRGLS